MTLDSTVLRIRIADPDRAFHVDADPNLDPTFNYDADPDLTF